MAHVQAGAPALGVPALLADADRVQEFLTRNSELGINISFLGGIMITGGHRPGHNSPTANICLFPQCFKMLSCRMMKFCKIVFIDASSSKRISREWFRKTHPRPVHNELPLGSCWPPRIYVGGAPAPPPPPTFIVDLAAPYPSAIE